MGFTITDKQTHVEVTIVGFVTAAEVRFHFDRLTVLVEEQRRRLGRARVVVDTAGSQPQSADVAGIMSVRAASLYVDDDRVAMITSSALLRLQIRRVTSDRRYAVFADRDEALHYVLS